MHTRRLRATGGWIVCTAECKHSVLTFLGTNTRTNCHCSFRVRKNHIYDFCPHQRVNCCPVERLFMCTTIAANLRRYYLFIYLLLRRTFSLVPFQAMAWSVHKRKLAHKTLILSFRGHRIQLHWNGTAVAVVARGSGLLCSVQDDKSSSLPQINGGHFHFPRSVAWLRLRLGYSLSIKRNQFLFPL